MLLINMMSHESKYGKHDVGRTKNALVFFPQLISMRSFPGARVRPVLDSLERRHVVLV